MFAKSILVLSASLFALSASLIVGGTSGAFAYQVGENPNLPLYANEVPENKIADRYPFLEQFKRPVVSRRLYARQQHAKLPLYYGKRLPQRVIGNRFQFLDQSANASEIIAMASARQAARAKPFTAGERAFFDRQTERFWY